MADKPSTGLAGVIAASTAVSDVDGRAGLLFYRGYDIHQPAGPAAFEEMAGWTAHVIEQHAANRLIRPDRGYIGERGLTWVPVGQR